jgi:hypothetical protein
VNLILFEPEGDMTSREVTSRSGRTVKHLIQLLDSVDEQIAFFRADGRNVSANAISKHKGFLWEETLMN